MDSLAIYNCQLYYRAEKTNIDTDALLRVSWLGCMHNTSDTQISVTAAAVQAVQEATLEGPMSPIEVYSCDLCILDSVGDSLQVTLMTIDDWHQPQWTDLILGLVIARLQDGILGQHQLKLTNPPEI